MKSRTFLLFTTLFLWLILFYGCSPPNYVLAPRSSLPVRDRLPQDVFGSFITVTASDSLLFSGELIGMRNDSLFILSDSLVTIHRNYVSKARIIVHLPNNYKTGGFVLMGLSGLVMIHGGGEYGGGPIGLGVASILINGIGLTSAQETENKKINYYDWSEGWEKVIVYSRFPQGIPSAIKLSELNARSK
jgi:hypothetical protein